MKKVQDTRYVCDQCNIPIDGLSPQNAIINFKNFVNDAVSDLKSVYPEADNITFGIVRYGYDGGAEIKLFFERDETDEEKKKRLKAVEYAKRRKEKKQKAEIELYKKLKKTYEGNI